MTDLESLLNAHPLLHQGVSLVRADGGYEASLHKGGNAFRCEFGATASEALRAVLTTDLGPPPY